MNAFDLAGVAAFFAGDRDCDKMNEVGPGCDSSTPAYCY